MILWIWKDASKNIPLLNLVLIQTSTTFLNLTCLWCWQFWWTGKKSLKTDSAYIGIRRLFPEARAAYGNLREGLRKALTNSGGSYSSRSVRPEHPCALEKWNWSTPAWPECCSWISTPCNLIAYISRKPFSFAKREHISRRVNAPKRSNDSGYLRVKSL